MLDILTGKALDCLYYERLCPDSLSHTLMQNRNYLTKKLEIVNGEIESFQKRYFDIGNKGISANIRRMCS